ncbi:MAG: PKD domain-containing protein [Bacteroidetes bacterium]|nr:MAG: PKD domain-containing protein [Bacteroidota bacterium]
MLFVIQAANTVLMKKHYLLTAGLAICWALLTRGQDVHTCGTPPPQGNLLMQNDPAAEQKQRQLAAGGPLVLPVIFHVFHSLYSNDLYGTGTNVLRQDLEDMLNFTNTLLRKQNPDTALIPAPFQPMAADCGIELCLAQTDPNGNTMYEAGVVRVNAATSGVPAALFTQPTQFSQNYAAAYAWDPTRYLNVWIMPMYFYSSYAGWGMFPDSSGLAGVAASNNNGAGDGIYITYLEVNSQTSIMAHEIGHFLGLRHVWGDSNCGDDYCNDTPTQAASNSGCPAFPHISCSNAPNGDMFNNYMDYTTDACKHLFTYDQKIRMQTVLANSPRRRELPLSTACTPGTTLPPVASFVSSPAVACAMQPVQYSDNSGYQPTSWQWIFPGGSPANSTQQNPQVMYAMPGIYGATLIVSNSAGSDTISISTTVSVFGYGIFPSAENFESMQVPPPNWDLMSIVGNMPPPSWQLAGASAYGIGSYSMSIFNWNFHPVRSQLLDFSNYASPTLSFDYACAPHAQFQPDNSDWMYIQVSTDCGVTFSNVLYLDSVALNTAPPAVNFVPNVSQWRHAVADLWAYAGMAGVYVQFDGRALPNYLYLDNINLYDQGAMSVQTVAGENTMTLMPNPSAGETKIHISSSGDNRSIEVCDVTGRKIAAFAVTKDDFVLEEETGKRLEAGMYIVSFRQNGNLRSSRRLVIAAK